MIGPRDWRLRLPNAARVPAHGAPRERVRGLACKPPHARALRAVEKVTRALREVFVDHPSHVHYRPVEMIFQHPLDGPRLSALFTSKFAVEVEAVVRGKVLAYES